MSGSGGGPRLLLLVAAIGTVLLLLTCVACGIGWALVTRTGRPEPMPVDDWEITEPIQAADPAAGANPAFATPAAEVRNLGEGTTRTGARIWLLDYVNVGTTPIARPNVTVSMFDAAGQRVGEQNGYARRDELGPGQSVTILVLKTNPPEFVRNEVQIAAPRPLTGESHEVVLSVIEQQVQRERFGQTLVGTVRNDSGVLARFAKVIVVGRDATGKPVAFADTFVTNRDLPPGQESGFSVRVGAFVLSEPVSYEVTSVGRR